MQDVYIVADNVLSPIGRTTADNFINLKKGISGVKLHDDRLLSDVPFYAALFDKDEPFFGNETLTKFEKMLITSITGALNETGIDSKSDKTILIICSTKGNISLLESETTGPGLYKRIALSNSGRLVAGHFGLSNRPVIISNACISGVLGIITAMRLLRTGKYENAIVTGADMISKFIVSGFQSFQALSSTVCKPFDRSRDGLNLGEGAGTVILSTNKNYAGNIKVKGGSVSNDANHISGPSRTGQELAMAITHTLKDATLAVDDVGFISAHGTATVYNDEMEANAIGLALLSKVPLNSLKGYYGHTLGAAGLIESIISLQSLKENLFLPTPGYKRSGVNSPVNVCTMNTEIAINNFIKTASGFGGCNAAIVFGK